MPPKLMTAVDGTAEVSDGTDVRTAAAHSPGVPMQPRLFVSVEYVSMAICTPSPPPTQATTKRCAVQRLLPVTSSNLKAPLGFYFVSLLSPRFPLE